MIHEGLIPEEVVAAQNLLRFHLRTGEDVAIQQLPADEPLRCHGCDLWWVNGQFYLYDPGDFSSPPRMQEFEWRPRRFLPRRVRVFLPRCYDLNAPKRYPLLLLLDGQNVFSPGSQFGSWDADLSVTRLIRRTDVPELIVVAIDNTRERHEEYVPEYGRVDNRRGRGGEFLRALASELLPQLNRQYRLLGTAESTALVGSSLGGLLAWFAAQEAAHHFGICGAVSPSMWVNYPENQRRARRDPGAFARLWMDSGGPGLGDGYERTLFIRDLMLRRGHRLGTEFMHTVTPTHSHSESDWAKRFPTMLRWMFPPEWYGDRAPNFPGGAA